MMSKSKNQIFSVWFPSLYDYGDMMKLATQTTEMLMASSVVIFHRSILINQALLGQGTWKNPEFQQLWQEKVMVGAQAYGLLFNSMIKQSFSMQDNSMQQVMRQGIRNITRAALPYHSKTRANALRLTKKS